MSLSGLEMGGNTVGTLKIDGKHELLTIFSSRRHKQNATYSKYFFCKSVVKVSSVTRNKC